jgi:hypothetical protein
MSDYLALSTTDSEKVTQPNRMERDFINPIKILELTIPPEDAEHNKVPGIFFSKPCNLFKKSFCWYSTQQTSAISLFLRYVLLLTVTACSYCCLMLIVTTEKQRKSQAKSHLSLNTLSADFCNSFYFLCSAAA